MADDVERDLAEYGVSGGFWASLDSSDTFKLSAHSSQTVKFSNIQTVSKLKLILSNPVLDYTSTINLLHTQGWGVSKMQYQSNVCY